MLEIFVIMLLVSVCCSQLGSILVIRQQAIAAEAITHTVLLGIVIGFLMTNNLNSPWLIILATICGVLTIFIINFFKKIWSIGYDSATGFVFPLLFAIAIILISLYANNVHIDIDMVLMGEIIFAPLNRTTILGISLSVAFIKSLILLVIIIGYEWYYYNPLVLFLSDEEQAKLLGVNTKKINTSLLLLISLSTVLFFDIIGSFTVICLFVFPTLLTLPYVKTYYHLLIYNAIVTSINCIISIFVANYFDLSISSVTCVMSFFLFCLSLMLPKSTG